MHAHPAQFFVPGKIVPYISSIIVTIHPVWPLISECQNLITLQLPYKHLNTEHSSAWDFPSLMLQVTCKYDVLFASCFIIITPLDIQIPDNFVPFGPANGDSIVPQVDDGSSGEIRLDRDVSFFSLNYNRIYVG